MMTWRRIGLWVAGGLMLVVWLGAIAVGWWLCWLGPC